MQAPDVKWDDIGGLTDIKEELTEAVEWPLKYGTLFEKRLNLAKAITDYVDTLSAGSYTLTGQSATQGYGNAIAAGSFLLTGLTLASGCLNLAIPGYLFTSDTLVRVG